MTDPYAVGLSADKLWSTEELCAAQIASRNASSGPGGAVDLSAARHNARFAISFGALCSLLLAIYALSPGGVESVLNTLAIAGLTVSAVVLVRVWDELRLLWSQNRGQNPAKGAGKAKLR